MLRHPLLPGGAYLDETPRPPTWAASRAKAPDAESKVEGGFPDGLPLVAYETNTGLGDGLGAHYTIPGARADPHGAYTPDRHRFYAQAYVTTGGYQQHIVSYDGFYVGDSPNRIRAVFMLERNIEANYFGIGTPRSRPQLCRHELFDPYGAACARRDRRSRHFGYWWPQGQVQLERSFWGGRLRGLYGLNVQHIDVTRFDSPARTTKLGDDCAAGLVTGCDGGWNNAAIRN